MIPFIRHVFRQGLLSKRRQAAGVQRLLCIPRFPPGRMTEF